MHEEEIIPNTSSNKCIPSQKHLGNGLSVHFLEKRRINIIPHTFDPNEDLDRKIL